MPGTGSRQIKKILLMHAAACKSAFLCQKNAVSPFSFSLYTLKRWPSKCIVSGLDQTLFKAFLKLVMDITFITSSSKLFHADIKFMWDCSPWSFFMLQIYITMLSKKKSTPNIYRDFAGKYIKKDGNHSGQSMLLVQFYLYVHHSYNVYRSCVIKLFKKKKKIFVP